MSKNGSLISRISPKDLQDIVLEASDAQKAKAFALKNASDCTAFAKIESEDDDSEIVAYDDLNPHASITTILKEGADERLAVRAMFIGMSLDTALLDMDPQSIEVCQALKSEWIKTEYNPRFARSMSLVLGAAGGLAACSTYALAIGSIEVLTVGVISALSSAAGYGLGRLLTDDKVKFTRQKAHFLYDLLDIYDTDVEPGDLALVLPDEEQVIDVGTYAVRINYVGNETVEGNIIIGAGGAGVTELTVKKHRVFCALEEHDISRVFTSADIGGWVSVHKNDSVFLTGRIVGVGKKQVFISPYEESGESEKVGLEYGSDFYVFKELRARLKDSKKEKITKIGSYR